MIVLLPIALAPCLTLPSGSDQITAADLAAVLPAFAAVAVGTRVGWAPAPGVRRVLRAAELRRLAARLGIAPAPEKELCVERPVAPLQPDRLLAAMRRQLPLSEIEILDYSRTPVPEGALEFPRNGLRRIANGAYWSGYVVYAGNRKFAVWAKLQLRTPPPPVSRGDTVQVDVWSGRAHLALEARAEGSGSAGERVLIRNPGTQKRFYARIEGPGRVSIHKETP